MGKFPRPSIPQTHDLHVLGANILLYFIDEVEKPTFFEFFAPVVGGEFTNNPFQYYFKECFLEPSLGCVVVLAAKRTIIFLVFYRIPSAHTLRVNMSNVNGSSMTSRIPAINSIGDCIAPKLEELSYVNFQINS